MKYTLFALLDECIIRLENTLRLLRNDDRELFPAKITQLGLLIEEICNIDPDPFLAAVYADDGHELLYIHTIYTAILCDILSKQLAIPEVKRLPLILAALTHDIGMLDYHNQLNTQKEKLTPQEISTLHEHPKEGADLLLELGVDEDIWLDAVLQHHERSDGSGYPHGLKNKEISTPSKILALCDTYAAMIRPRPHRKISIMPEHALRDIFLDGGKTIDSKIAELLLKSIGIYPPGALVKLKNGEIAVVISRTNKPNAPIVASCMTASGALKPNKTKHDSSFGNFKILHAIPRQKYRLLHTSIPKLWPQTIDMMLYHMT